MMREVSPRWWKNSRLKDLIRNAEKLVQQNELHVAVVVALCECKKTIMWQRNLFVVLDRVCHFRQIPIHRFFAVNRYRFDADTLQERPWRSVTDRSKAPDAATATNNSGGQRGGGCLWSVVDSQTQRLSIKFNIKNSNVSSQFCKSVRPTHCLVTYYTQCASNADTESSVTHLQKCN